MMEESLWAEFNRVWEEFKAEHPELTSERAFAAVISPKSHAGRTIWSQIKEVMRKVSKKQAASAGRVEAYLFDKYENKTGENMTEKNTLESIVKQVEEGKFRYQEEVWSAIQDLLNEAGVRQMDEIDEASRAGNAEGFRTFTREQLLARLMNTPEGARLWDTWNRLPRKPVKSNLGKSEPLKLGNTYQKIEKMAQELLDSGGVPTLSQGFDEVVTENPELWVELANEIVS